MKQIIKKNKCKKVPGTTKPPKANDLPSITLTLSNWAMNFKDLTVAMIETEWQFRHPLMLPDQSHSQEHHQPHLPTALWKAESAACLTTVSSISIMKEILSMNKALLTNLNPEPENRSSTLKISMNPMSYNDLTNPQTSNAIIIVKGLNSNLVSMKVTNSNNLNSQQQPIKISNQENSPECLTCLTWRKSSLRSIKVKKPEMSGLILPMLSGKNLKKELSISRNKRKNPLKKTN